MSTFLIVLIAMVIFGVGAIIGFLTGALCGAAAMTSRREEILDAEDRKRIHRI